MSKRAQRETRVCINPTCGKTFEAILNAAQASQRCCSRACARTVDNKARSERSEQEWLSSPASLCACGEGRIPYAVRHTTKYHTPECRRQYGGKKQRDPLKWVTRVCQNETCGKTFELRTSSTAYGKYCSNACAYRHTKTKQHILVDDAVVLDSGWEALFWGLCAFDKIPCERYDRARGAECGEGRWYAPDFLLPTMATAVEIKGLEDSGDAGRWETYRKAYPDLRLLVLDRFALDQLLSAGSRERWLRGGEV